MLVEAHDKCGHQGATHTYCLIKHQYYWNSALITFFHILPSSMQWKTRSLSQVSKTYTQETLWKGSIKLGQIHQSSSCKLHSNTQHATAETPFFLVHGRYPNLPLCLLLEPMPRFLGDPESSLLILKAHHLALPTAKKTLDENHFRTAQKTMDREAPSFKIGDRVYFKNKQPDKWDLK